MFDIKVFQDTPSTIQYLNEKHVNVKGILHFNFVNSLIWKINSLPHCALIVLLHFLQIFITLSKIFNIPYQRCLGMGEEVLGF